MNAHETYTQRRKAIDYEIKILKQKLKAMDAEEKMNLKDWGYAGNCDHILNLIGDITRGFLNRF